MAQLEQSGHQVDFMNAEMLLKRRAPQKISRLIRGLSLS